MRGKLTFAFTISIRIRTEKDLGSFSNFSKKQRMDTIIEYNKIHPFE